MNKRTVNHRRLKELIDQVGLGQVSHTTGVSVSWLQKAMAGCYKHGPRQLVRDAICNRYPIKEDELFPLVGAKRKAS